MNDLSKIEELYHEALRHAPAQREAFLKGACGNDRELLREIESLLAFDESAQKFFEKSPGDVAADLFSSGAKENLVGKQMNHYHILSPLGAGGMGEVYLAEDTRLKRKTAIKILPVQFSTDPERKIRFEQEARAVSALNHPNILTIFSIERSEHYNFIATEFIDGVTLREKIAEKNLSWPEAVEIAIQVAGALESAHSVGIIHRDIKPANIMLRRDGIVKVLDFGLAKSLEDRGAGEEDGETGRRGDREIGQPGASDGFISLSPPLPISPSPLPPFSPSPSSLLTNPGAVMGTINYMSPEQALGEKVDARTDIFSLGVVLYEMLSGGVQPFAGASDADIYDAMGKAKPPPSLLESNRELPPALDRIVRRALEKRRESRYQSAAGLRAELQKIREHSNLSAGHSTALKKRANFLKFALPPAVIGILLLAGVYFGLVRREPPAAAPKISNYTQLTSQSGEELSPSFSPDGKTIIYSSRENGNWDIYSQPATGSSGGGNLAPINLTADSAADDRQAVFSPGGDEIVFRSERDGGGIFVMSAAGKGARKISDAGFYPNWSPDGKEIVYCVDNFTVPSNRGVVPSELWGINLATGEKRLITGKDAVQPSWSPHGWRIAFWGVNAGGKRDIWTVAAAGGGGGGGGEEEPVAVTNDAPVDWNPFWSPDGRYLYFASDRGGSMNLWRVGIDEKSGAVSGEPEPATIPSGYGQFFSFSRDGKALIYVQTNISSNIWRVDFDQKAETVDRQPVAVTNDSTIKTDLSISADNEMLAYDTVGGKQEDIYVAKTDGSNIRRLTNTVEKDRVPQWSPDGRRIAFYSTNSGKYEGWIMDADGGNLRMVTKTPADRRIAMPVWSPSGKDLLFNISNYYPIIFDPDAEPDRQTPQELPHDTLPNHSFLATSWSADGKHLAGYSSDLGNDRSGVAVYDFDSQKYRHLTDFGSDAYWLADSRRLVFYTDEAIYLLDSQTGKTKQLLSVKPYRIQSIAITKDNRSIYYTIQKKESDIWMAGIQ